MLKVRTLDTSKRQDVKAWITLPHRLYANDPLWVPQMVDEAKMQTNRSKNPFFLHSDADFLVAEQDGEVVARLAVLEHKRFNALRNTHQGFFYLFESVDNFEVAEALFNTAFDWCRQHGLDTMVGPKGFLTADGMGMLVEGFHRRPAIGIAYNPPYYHDLMQRLGFERETDFMSGYVDILAYQMPERVVRLADKAKARYGYTVRTFNSKSELKPLVPLVIETYNAAFVDNWEFVPVTPEEGEVIGRRLLDIIDPKLIKLVWKDDKIIGFVLVYPNISAAIQRTRGRLWPFGFIQFLREFKRTEWCDANGAGVLEQYRGRGVDAIVAVELYKTIKGGNFKYSEMVQVDEGNSKMQAEMTALGVNWDKRHRIFHRPL